MRGGHHVSPSGSFVRPWTPQEVALLARGFIDYDLDGEELYQWCRNNGIDRTPGAIDVKLRDLRFFDDTLPGRKSRNGEPVFLKRSLNQDLRKREAALARRNLRLQIELAKLEAAAGVPLYKHGKLGE